MTQVRPDVVPAARGGVRLDSLTGVRMLAALGVFALHATGSAPGWVRSMTGVGDTGVSLFFVLSGFVLTWTARPHDRRRDFYRRRVARVVPNHVAMWLVVVVLVALAVGTHRWQGWPAVLAVLLLVQAWVPDQDVVLAVNGPSWTLSCEAFFYAAFPFLLPLLAGLRRRGRRVLLLVLGSGLPLWIALVSATTDGDRLTWLVANLPPVRLVEFVVGVLVALEVRDGRMTTVRLPAATALVAGALLVTALVPPAYATASVTMLPYAALLAALAHDDLRGGWSPLRAPWLVQLGVWSFAFYLVHEVVLRGLRVMAPGVVWWQVAAVALPLSVAGAALLHRLVEQPAERRLRPAERRDVAGVTG